MKRENRLLAIDDATPDVRYIAQNSPGLSLGARFELGPSMQRGTKLMRATMFSPTCQRCMCENMAVVGVQARFRSCSFASSLPLLHFCDAYQ